MVAAAQQRAALLLQLASCAARSASGVAAAAQRSGCSSSTLQGGTGLLLVQQCSHASTSSSWQQLAQQAALAAGRRGLASSAGPSAAAAAGAAAAAAAPRSTLRRIKAVLRDYKQLSKFRLSALVSLTASAGFAAGSGEDVDVAKLAWTSLGTLGAAACANALNQLYEVANDARMARTAARPLPTGRLSGRQAAVFALLSGAAGLWVLADKTNPLTAGLGAANIALYAGVYTPLKQLSVANTWVGAVVGAIPPLMGWAAAAGQLDPGAWVLAAALFSWQLPHFLALAWLCKDDYARGGFRMLPSIDPSGRRTAGVALRHTAVLLPLGALAMALHVASPWFAGEAAVLAAAMGAGALAFRANPSASSARKLFRGSLLYLPLLLAGLAVHREPNTQPVSWQQLRAAAADLLPEGLQPGRVWAGLHWPRLRPLEERYAMLVDLQRQVQQGVRCPSRAYAEDSGAEQQDAGEGGVETQQQQQEQQQVAAGRSGGDQQQQHQQS